MNNWKMDYYRKLFQQTENEIKLRIIRKLKNPIKNPDVKIEHEDSSC